MVISLEDKVLEELNAVDRDALMERMAKELPMISGELGMTSSGIAWRTGLDSERIAMIVSGKRKMKWSEYMSILFLLWDDGKGQEIIEKYDLFPDALKKAMAVNRNAHGGKQGA